MILMQYLLRIDDLIKIPRVRKRFKFYLKYNKQETRFGEFTKMDESSTQPGNDSRKVSPTSAHSEPPPSYSSSQGLPYSSECSTSELSITAKSIP
jgi:hypothetical protein